MYDGKEKRITWELYDKVPSRGGEFLGYDKKGLHGKG
jgi:hypothetical protein